MNWKERLSRIIAIGMYDCMTAPQLPHNIEQYVAAGNPGNASHEYPDSLPLPATFVMGGKKHNLQDYRLYTVSGNSMLPEGIHNGYELLTLPIAGEKVSFGDFIVIEVDRTYFQFRHHGKESQFKQKLRRAICGVDNAMTADELSNNLSGTFAEPLDDKEKVDLRDSLSEARSFYGDIHLFLSVTYHDGEIHYSFHPMSHIHSRVEGVAFSEGNNIKFKSASELSN